MASRKTPSQARKQPKQQRSRQTVASILEGAAQVLEDCSYASCTTDRIAERAGVAVGTVYQYFPDKDAIINALFDKHVSEVISFLNDLTEQVRNARVPLAQALHRIVLAVAEEQEHSGGMHRAVAEVEVMPPGVTQHSRAFHNELLEKLRQLLQASPEVTAKDITCTSYLVLGTVDAAIHSFLVQPPAGISLGSFLDELTRMLLAYLTAPVSGEV